MIIVGMGTAAWCAALTARTMLRAAPADQFGGHSRDEQRNADRDCDTVCRFEDDPYRVARDLPPSPPEVLKAMNGSAEAST